MAIVPDNLKIFHITHITNLAGIIGDQMLWSDRIRIEKDLGCQVVGMSRIKQRRLTLPVPCHNGTHVGDYVPFYFCPRSIMLFILARGNHPDIDYHEGQEPIVHLQVDLAATIEWADKNRVRWAFSSGNAGAYLTRFFAQATSLDQVDWQAVQAADWRDHAVKEHKQAEFLIHKALPWQLVEKIGVLSKEAAERVNQMLTTSTYKPPVAVMPAWYY